MAFRRGRSHRARWSSIRESQELRLFQKVFVRTPISSGKWSVQNGTLTFHCLTSVHASRVNHQLPFAIRSISDRDFIFVDYISHDIEAVEGRIVRLTCRLAEAPAVNL